MTVREATIKRYAIRATLIFFASRDRSVLLTEAHRRVAAYSDATRKLGMAITLDSIHAAARPAKGDSRWPVRLHTHLET